jgi:hypothetical protein
LTLHLYFTLNFSTIGKGGKNRRRGKGDGEESKRELEFKEDGTLQQISNFNSAFDILRIPGRRRVCLCCVLSPKTKQPPYIRRCPPSVSMIIKM